VLPEDALGDGGKIMKDNISFGCVGDLRTLGKPMTQEMWYKYFNKRDPPIHLSLETEEALRNSPVPLPVMKDGTLADPAKWGVIAIDVSHVVETA
jgi:hypothetical protein